MIQRLLALALTLTPLVLLPLTPCLTQDAPALSTTSEEVVVTGARYARPLAASPDKVTVIDSATIARSANLAQLLNEQAGIVVNGAYANPGKDRSIFLRNGGNQYTLILVDGQPLIDPSSLGGAVDLRLLSLDGIERIEILRGARSLLYGSDAVAGVINLITNKQTAPDPFKLHLRAAAQRYGTYEGQVAVSGRTEKLDYRVGYDVFTTQGLSEAVEPDFSTNDFDRDGATRQTYTASLTYRPTPALTLRPALRRASFDGDYDAGSFQDADNSYTNELWLPSLSVDYVQDKYRLGARYTYAATDRVFDDAAFGESPFRGRAQQGDAFGTTLLAKQLTLTAGTQVRYESLRGEAGAADTLDATNLAPYLQLSWQATERLLLEGGYRYNHHSAFGGQSNYSLSTRLQLTEPWSLRGSVASAFQSPTLDQLGGPFGANPDLQPQVSTSVELGTGLADARGRYRIDLSVFQRQIEQLIVYDFTLGYRNRDEQRDRGVELEAQALLSKRVAISGNLSYVKGRLKAINDTGGVTETEDFPRRPRTTGFLGLTYTADSPFTARLSGTYVGERQDLIFDEQFIPIRPDLDAYLVVNAYAEYKLLRDRSLTVFGEVRNLTDSKFVEVTGFSTLGVTPRVGVGWVW
ncbi:Colicin I receptor [Neolewinella maritima]|uniref:Colicin I receptor n=1 Tax=Neolewinella maritima TaxID=1383882 RepID=A0ABN8F593_9BACT|nr:TonB-dependent receptor [Neolewinella maritima]CAH0999102.1 Colicin I receptor [Neolewinella maritima]